MTTYAVTVQYTGDFIVDAETAEDAEKYVASIIPHATPETDWYLVEIEGIREEE